MRKSFCLTIVVNTDVIGFSSINPTADLGVELFKILKSFLPEECIGTIYCLDDTSIKYNKTEYLKEVQNGF